VFKAIKEIGLHTYSSFLPSKKRSKTLSDALIFLKSSYQRDIKM
jgi:hypothetical protein